MMLWNSTARFLQVGKTAKSALLNLFGSVAQEKARKLGYKVHQDLIRHGGYHVVHLRAEQDWRVHCQVWFSWHEKRDNCMNNTFQIGNVLLSEGISPALPVYLATGLSELEIQSLRDLPKHLHGRNQRHAGIAAGCGQQQRILGCSGLYI